MKRNKVDISVVMPVYNGERYLRESIDSVLGQTNKNWELILVNDCSTDSSYDIMKEYESRDARIKVISNAENKRLPASLNIGFAAAGGRYYTWTSDDNIYEEDAFQVMYNYLESNSECGLVYCDMWNIDERGNIISEVHEVPEGLYSQDCVGACFMYRSEVVDKVGGYDTNMFLVEDYAYWIQIAKYYRVDRIAETHYYYRLHSESLTGTREFQIREKLNELRIREILFLARRATGEEREKLCTDMWLYNRKKEIISFFYTEDEIPKKLKQLMKVRQVDTTKKTMIFGAGTYGKRALNVLGKEKVVCFIDNNTDRVGQMLNDIRIESYQFLLEHYKEYNIVIAVGINYLGQLVDQLLNDGIEGYITYLDLVSEEDSQSVLSEEKKRKDRIVEAVMSDLDEFKSLLGRHAYVGGYQKDFEIYEWIEKIAQLCGCNINSGETRQSKELMSKVLRKLNEVIVEKNLISENFALWSKINIRISEIENEKAGFLSIPRIDFMITERCSLKCRECLNLMQYYQNPCNYSLESLKLNLDCLSQSVDEIMELRVLGGEPFVNPAFYDICEFICNKDNIKHVVVFTNATIPVNQEKLKKIDQKKLLFYISNYGIDKQRIGELNNNLREMGFQTCVMDFTKTPWIEHSGFERKNIEKELAEESFAKCDGRDCPVVMKNKIYMCEYLANAENLKAIPRNNNNSIELASGVENLKEELKSYLYKEKPLPGCYWCDRWMQSKNGTAQNVEPGLQTPNPLDYVSIDENNEGD